MTGTEALLFSNLSGHAQFLAVSHRRDRRAALTIAIGAHYACAMTRHETPPLSPQELERYARHIVLPEIGGAGQQRLKRARVLVIGAGGLGAPVLEYLAAAGVGTLGIVDDDIVSLSNLQRQVIHDTAAVGLQRPKARQAPSPASIRMYRSRSTRARLTASNAAELVRGYDIVADGSDNFDTRYAVADACAGREASRW